MPQHERTREELLAELATLRQREEAREAMERAHARALADLGERVKELNCLYSISRLAQRENLPREELVRGVAEVVRDSWQYPEIACARVELEGVAFATPGDPSGPWVQTAPVRVRGDRAGEVRVAYGQERPDCGEGPFLPEERHLIDAVASLLARLIEADRTKDHVRRLSGLLLRAQETERRRIACDLHDKVAQDLSLLKMALSSLPGRLARNPAELSGATDELAGILTRAISELRDLSYGLLPPGLEQFGLAATLSRLCEECTGRQGLRVECFADGMDGLAVDFETAINLYRIAQEALRNVRRHSGARNARVRLVASHPNIILRVEDDGRGFDSGDLSARTPEDRRLGLWSMRERARSLGGRLDIRPRPGGGICLVAEVPAGRKGDA
jgi:signal transduction histidine kinase